MPRQPLDRAQARRAAAEFVGTFALVFAGCGAVMVNAKTGELGHVGVAFTFGLVIMAMIYAVGHVSERISTPLSRSRSPQPPLPLAARLRLLDAQLLGRSRLHCSTRRSATSRTSVNAALGLAGSVVPWEFLMTFFLMFVIMAVATDTRAVGEAAAIAIGGTVGLDAMFGGPISGASMNPFRSLAPALVSGNLHALWLYLVAPVLGAAAGALTYQFVRGEAIDSTAGDDASLRPECLDRL